MLCLRPAVVSALLVMFGVLLFLCEIVFVPLSVCVLWFGLLLAFAATGCTLLPSLHTSTLYV